MAVVTFIATSTVRAERFISLDAYGSTIGAPMRSTFHIGISELGNLHIQELFTLTIEEGDTGDVIRAMRDRAIPAQGIPGICRRAEVHFGSSLYHGIQVYQSDTIQFWGSTDGQDWQVIDHGGDAAPLTMLENASQYWGLRVGEYGSNPQTGSAAAPAVGAFGLVTMLTLACMTAVYVFRRFPRVAR